MKAEEIRAYGRGVKVNGGSNSGIIFAICEVAAQLAELNQSLRDVNPELNLPAECRARKCDYYAAYLPHTHGDGDMTHEAYHLEAAAAINHYKNCPRCNGESKSTDVCKTAEGYERRLRA